LRIFLSSDIQPVLLVFPLEFRGEVDKEETIDVKNVKIKIKKR